jgi:hypothetical protein
LAIAPASRTDSAKARRPPTRTRQRSTSSPCSTRSAHGRAPEHHGLGEQQRGALLHVDIDAALEPRAVEQDGLLRQPAQGRAGGEVEPDRDVGRRVARAIDLLRRRRADDELRARPGRHLDAEAVAARHAARRVHQNGLERAPGGPGKAHAQRALLGDAPAPRRAGVRRDRERDPPLGAIGGEDVLGGCGGRRHEASR